MSTVAIPATATTSKTSTEADMVRHAARGDAEAFDEVYRRHSQPAWRLAQAVAPDRDSAVEAFRAGFVRAVRSHRGGRRGGVEPFRPEVMAAVYRASIDQAQAQAHSAPTSGPRRAPSAEAALADAAFRSLPERWRAAVWLSEVENLATDRVARVLAVSDAVAAQLVSRGHRGLAGRFSQAHHAVPEHVGEVLRPLTLPMPANLAETTRARWAAAGSDRAAVIAPLGGWLAERGARPMAVTAGALLGLGLIGLGLVPGGSSVRATLGAANGGSGAGSVPVHTCDGLTCPAAPGSAGAAGAAGGGVYGSNAAYMSALSGAGGAASGGYGYGGGYIGGSGGGLTPGGGSGTAFGGAGAGTGGSGTSGTGGGGTGSGGGTTGTGGGSGGGGSTGTTSPTTILSLAPVASVTQSGGTTSVNLLPSGSGSTATVSGGTSGVGATVGGTTVLSTTTTTAPATTTTTTTLPLLGTVTNTLGGLTGTSSTTTTTLLGGL